MLLRCQRSDWVVNDGGVRDLLPNPLNVSDFSLDTQFPLSADFSGHLLDFGGEYRQLVDHTIDGVDEIQDFSEHWHAHDFLSQVSSGDGRL